MESEASRLNDGQRAAVRQTPQGGQQGLTVHLSVSYLTVIDCYRQLKILREFAGVLVYVVLLVSACGGIIEESSGHSIFRNEFSTMPGELKLKNRLHVVRRSKSAL